jgi:drug/metabolite transporter (DMT)-like permease
MQTYAIVLFVAAVLSLACAPLVHGFDPTPGWTVFGWLALVTISGQLVGWLLVARYSAQLPSDASSALLLLTPVGAVVLGTVVLHERPSILQYAGCVIILGAGYLAAAQPTRR